MRFSNIIIVLIQEDQFLGIQLNQKLYQKGYFIVIKRKFMIQQFALIRLVVSIQSCSFIQAREVYIKVVYSTLVYRAGVQYQLVKYYPKKIVAKLTTSQLSYLRIIIGVYRAILVYLLEIEVTVLLLNIYLNKQVVDFEAYLERTRIGTLIYTTYNRVVVKLYQYKYNSQFQRGSTRASSLKYREG